MVTLAPNSDSTLDSESDPDPEPNYDNTREVRTPSKAGVLPFVKK